MPCVTFDHIRVAIASKTEEAAVRLEECGICDRRNAGLVAAAAACALLPLEISHLISMIVGVLAYMLIQSLQPGVQRGAEEAAQAVKAPLGKASRAWGTHPQGFRRGGLRDGGLAEHRSTGSPAGIGVNSAARAARQRPGPVQEGPKLEIRKPSAMPVAAPTFQAMGWEAEVMELLSRISPTPEGDAAVERIAQSVKRIIAPIIPEAEVAGVAGGNIAGGTAFGVAVPEVDIVISVNPTLLLGRLQGRWAAGRGAAARIDAQKLQKSAIRACTDRLVGTGTFKFRRSAFRGSEPKVTIIAPTNCTGGQGVPVNLSVNSLTPLYNAALLAECGRLEPRARELILLTKRWAKDRGLCHAAKGHLSPYVWTLLVIFFCQVHDSDEGTLLPPLEGFETCSGLMKGANGKPMAAAKVPAAAASVPATAVGSTKRTAGALFKEFMTFYVKTFDWRSEAVSIRLGRRAPPERTLPLHIIVDSESGATEVGPSIEDPFEPMQNLGSCTTAVSLAHLRSEFSRAQELCANGASLSELLEPWAPPEAAAAGQGGEGLEEEHAL